MPFKDPRWLALRLLLVELLAENPNPPNLNGQGERFARLLASGASVADIANACELSRDDVVAALVRMARG